MTPQKLTLWAPAKINFSLFVGRRRADGYHEISSVMQKICLYDTLTFSKSDKISLSCDLSYLPCDERNLCVKAAGAYFEKTGLAGGVDIRVRKAIPVGAGLGGGSADAAATLRALCRLYRPLEEEELFSLALSLGADVPFCLSKAVTCLCEGVGEELTPLSFVPERPLYFVLVKDERKLSTAQVYQSFDELVHPGCCRQDAVLQALSRGDVPTLCASLFNDLEMPVLAQKPALSALMDEMLSLGALGARMSGAGPTVYGLFDSRVAAERAAEHFSAREFCRVAALCKTPE